jgi:hypothetical protein
MRSMTSVIRVIAATASCVSDWIALIRAAMSAVA